MNYERVLINGMEGVRGDISFSLMEIPLFNDLLPGEQVIEIGTRNKNGNYTSCHRILSPPYPLIYKGKMNVKGDYKGDRRAVFSSSDPELINMPVYLTFIIMEDREELWMPMPKILNLYTYKKYLKAY